MCLAFLFLGWLKCCQFKPLSIVYILQTHIYTSQLYLSIKVVHCKFVSGKALVNMIQQDLQYERFPHQHNPDSKENTRVTEEGTVEHEIRRTKLEITDAQYENEQLKIGVNSLMHKEVYLAFCTCYENRTGTSRWQRAIPRIQTTTQLIQLPSLSYFERSVFSIIPYKRAIHI